MKKKWYILGLGVAFSCASCDEWLTIQPETMMAAELLFQTEEGITQGLNGAYYKMLACYGPTRDLGGDGFLEYLANTYYVDPLSGSDAYLYSIHSYEQSESQKNVNEQTFMNLYNVVANLNSLLREMAKNVDNLIPDTYKIARGEAYALRACCHLDIMRIWGPVPSEADASQAYLPYVHDNSMDAYTYYTFDRYMDYLQADLDSAEMFLRDVEPVLATTFAETETTGVEWPYRKSRCNYFGVLALQARAALWRGDKEKALRYAQMVIDAKNEDGTSRFRLTTPEDDVSDYTVTDRTHYSEHIFGVKCTDADAGDYAWPWGYRAGYPCKSMPEYVEELYGENFSADLRYTNFWKSGGGSWVDDGSGNYVYQYSAFSIAKYDDFSSTSSEVNNNFPIVRLPEMYFIVMECGTLSEANTLYEEYCAARNVDYVPLTEGDRQERVILESIREYVAEGQNFFTYKRNNVSLMYGASVSCSAEQYIVPLPEAETTVID